MDKSALNLSEDVETLKHRFIEVWGRNLCAGSASKAIETAAIVINKHQEHHRHYHNTRHLSFCLAQQSQAQSAMDEPDIVELALWFHDAVYLPNASDNEAQSAALFAQLTRGQLSESLINSVSEIIPATNHQTAPESQSEAYVLDIDLASIGLPWEEFNRDNEALRAEVPRIHDNLYYEGKTAFLSTLLNREKIYYTKYFFDKYEQQARDNIKRYMNQ